MAAIIIIICDILILACLSPEYLPSPPKSASLTLSPRPVNKYHRLITWVGFEPTTIAILEQCLTKKNHYNNVIFLLDTALEKGTSSSSMYRFQIYTDTWVRVQTTSRVYRNHHSGKPECLVAVHTVIR